MILCLLVELARMAKSDKYNMHDYICILHTQCTCILHLFKFDAEYCSNSRLSNLSILQDLWLNVFLLKKMRPIRIHRASLLDRR